ncbi:sulfate transporter-like [Elysia marginata]|uniref:Sulfate transporter-like n=1 Tax=Elysia marginata TaxID=1093978 RepID=A0AAV4EF34_9GAST|nr:sulfate transporter-like [Elysia marginata]
MNSPEESSGGQPSKYCGLVEFENQFKDVEEKTPVSTVLCKQWKKKTSGCSIKDSLLDTFPIVRTIRKYEVREDLPNDLIAGMTSGVMMIPQGMAFAALSTLPPIVGLYISFFASATYALLGTGRQVSWGCIAVLSIMMGQILDKYDASVKGGNSFDCFNDTLIEREDAKNNRTAGEFSSDPSDPVTSRRMEVASGVTLVAALVVIVASRVGLSRVSSLLSNSLITGFTVGIAFHVGTSQLKEILGVRVARQSGIGSIVKTWIELLKKIPDTNVATLITSAICILAIYLVKRFVNEKYKKKLRVPIPIDLIVAIIATLVTEFGRIHKDHGVRVVGDVPTGLPAPKFPDLSLSSSYIGDGLVIAVVAYTQTLALTKTFGLEHNYPVDPAQEMLASGMVNLVCAVFSGYIAAGSVSRSMVQNGAGGRTQLASLVAAIMVLLVILFAGPYFYYLPKCVLSAIIVVSLRSMMLKLLTIPEMWRRSPLDCSVWVFTCAAVVVLNPDLGLLVSVVLSLLIVVLRTMVNPVSEAGQIDLGDSLSVELRSLRGYSAAKPPRQARIVKIRTPLFYVNSEAFVTGIYEKTGVNPVEIRKANKKREENTAKDPSVTESYKETKEELGEEVQNFDEGKSTQANNGNTNEYHREVAGLSCPVIILDAAHMAFVDLMGVQALQMVIKEMKTVEVEVFISSLPENVIPLLKSTGFWEKHGDRLFLSVDAALASLVSQQKK